MVPMKAGKISQPLRSDIMYLYHQKKSTDRTMKINRSIQSLILVAVLSTAAISCTSNPLEVYSGEPSGLMIKQPVSRDSYGRAYQWADSVEFSFVSFASDVDTATYRICIQTIGGATEYDRPYTFRFLPELSTGVEDEDFSLHRNRFVIPQGKCQDTVFVTLKRTPKLRITPVELRFAIEENEYFNLPIQEYKNSISWSSDAEMLSATTFTITLSESYPEPFIWGYYASAHLGDYSPRKLLLIEELFGWSYADWDEWLIPTDNFDFVARILHDYLQEKADNGIIITDDRGEPLQLPGANKINYGK